MSNFAIIQFSTILLAISNDVPFEQTDFAIETKTFMLKYGIFMLAGFLSSFGTLGFQSYNSASAFAKHLLTAMTATLSLGIILFEMLNFSIPVVFAITLIIGLFLKYIIDNTIQIINKLPNYSEKVADKYVDNETENKQ